MISMEGIVQKGPYKGQPYRVVAAPRPLFPFHVVVLLWDGYARDMRELRYDNLEIGVFAGGVYVGR